MTETALIVDDEPQLCRLMQLTLNKMSINCDVAYDLATAYEHLKNNTYDFCLTDMKLPDGSGLDLVQFINRQDWNMPVAVITAHGNMDIAIEALKLGAFDFVNKPLELPRLKQLVDNALKVAKEAAQNEVNATVTHKSPAQIMLDERLIGESPAMQKLKTTIIKLARSQAPVFLWGASGTGKEVVAKLIHDLSPRREGNFVPVNCGAIPSELMESEFFGHKKGSFTGATTDKQGLFQQANGGTLFLDEVADLPLAMQVKLLRAIQEKTVRAIGDTKEVPVDIRILSATHKDLNKLVQQSAFRQDLFYRINVIELKLPTLNERSEDVPMLAEHFLHLIQQEWQIEDDITLSTGALLFLQTCEFEGNVRELRNLLERAVTLSESTVIDTPQLQKNQPRKTSKPTLSNSPSNSHQSALEQNQNNPIMDMDTSSKTPHSHPVHQTNTSSSKSSNSYKNTGIQFVTNLTGHSLSSFNSQPRQTNHSKSSKPDNLQMGKENPDTSMVHSHAYLSLANKLMEGLDVNTGLPTAGLEDFLNKQESIILINALNQTRWNKTQAAKLLGMSLRSLRYRMDKLNVGGKEDG